MTTSPPPRPRTTAISTTVRRPTPWLLACSVLCLLSSANVAVSNALLLIPRSARLTGGGRSGTHDSNSPISTSLPPPTATITCASSCFRPPEATTSSALKYAIRAADGPMSKVDSTKSGGCPFLTTSYVHKTYAVPALFDDEDSRPIVLFDGECNLCYKFVQTLLKYDSNGNLRFAALQSRVGDLLIRRMSDELRAQVLASPLDNGGGEDEERYKSIVVCGRDTTYIRSSAVYKILQLLEGSSKRLRLIQYLALIGYVLPTRVRDGAYQFISKRRKKWFGSSDECLLWDDRFEDRFVDDGVLTGSYRDPFANPHAEVVVPSCVNLFEGESPLVRGDRVRIIWPSSNTKSADPSVSYDSEFPDGICLIGGIGKISTVDLPNRVVLRVDRESIGLGNDGNGDMTVFAWVKPQEIAAL